MDGNDDRGQTTVSVYLDVGPNALLMLFLLSREKSDAWVKKNFSEEFWSKCRDEANEKHNVPAGDARRRSTTSLYVKQLVIKYRQKTQPLCVLYAMLSALYIYGDRKAFSHLIKLQSAMLTAGSNEVYYSTTKTTGRCPRTELLFQTIRTSSSIKWNATAIPSSIASMSALMVSRMSPAKLLKDLIPTPDHILLAALSGTDGSTTHAVAIVRSSTVHPLPCGSGMRATSD